MTINSSIASSSLCDELKQFIAQMTPDELKNWSAQSVARIPQISQRRIQQLVSDAKSAGGQAGGLLGGGLKGLQSNLANMQATGAKATQLANVLGGSFKNNPAGTAPALLGLVLGMASGTAHPALAKFNSLLADPVVGGTLMETSTLSLTDLAGSIAKKLPSGSSFWSQLDQSKTQIANQFAQGGSLTDVLGGLLKSMSGFSLPAETTSLLDQLNDSEGAAAAAAPAQETAKIGGGLKGLFGR